MRGFLLRLASAALVCSMAGAAGAEDLSYVDNRELIEEKSARETDIQRTQGRIASLSERISALETERDRIKGELREIDDALASKTMLLYRLSRNGKALRYLTTADSGTAFLKRIALLKKLISSQMVARREKGLAASTVESSIADMRVQLGGAQQLQQELESTLAELNAEIEKRSAGSYVWR